MRVGKSPFRIGSFLERQPSRRSCQRIRVVTPLLTCLCMPKLGARPSIGQNVRPSTFNLLLPTTDLLSAIAVGLPCIV